MSTYNSPVDVVPATLVRSSNINDVDAATANAFALLPDETLLKQGKVTYAVDTGTANTYLAALPVSPIGYVDGLALTFKAGNANTGACTINVNALGVVSIAREDGAALVTGDIVAGQMCTVRYSTTSGKFQLGGTTNTYFESNYAKLASPSLTGAPTAPTAPFGTNTNQLATMAALVSQAFNAVDLPGQAGNAGRYLKTDGVSANWAYERGSGGATLTTNTALTSASPSANALNFPGYGYYVTLPAATALSAGIAQFSFNNISDYGAGIKDGAGNILGWVPAKSSGSVNLSDNSTTAGAWGLNEISKVGVVAEFISSLLSQASRTGSNGLLEIVLDADRTLYVFGFTTLYGVVHNKTTNTWGAATSIATGAGTATWQCTGVLYSADKTLVSFINAASADKYYVVVTTSALTLTVGTPVASGTATVMGTMIMCNGSAINAYSDTTISNGLESITVSGTVPTLGTFQNITAVDNGSNPPLLFASGAVVRTFTHSGSGTIICKPFTVSGTTLTAGTLATLTGTPTDNAIRVNKLANGNMCVSANMGTYTCFTVSLSGTTETGSSSVTLFSSSSDSAVDCAVIGNKIVFVGYSTGTNTIYINVFIDASGTPSVGTSRQYATANAYVAAYITNVSGSNVSTVLRTTATEYSLVTFDCSGASPVEASLRSFSFDPTQYQPLNAAQLRRGGRTNNMRMPNRIHSTSATYLFPLATTSTPMVIGITNTITIYTALPTKIVNAVGIDTTECYSISGFGDVNNGVVLQKIKCATV